MAKNSSVRSKVASVAATQSFALRTLPMSLASSTELASLAVFSMCLAGLWDSSLALFLFSPGGLFVPMMIFPLFVLLCENQQGSPMFRHFVDSGKNTVRDTVLIEPVCCTAPRDSLFGNYGSIVFQLSIERATSLSSPKCR
jgi:hypothetical protein